MKKLLTLICVLAMGQYSFAQMAGTAHDLTGTGWSGVEICNVCHTPHNGTIGIDAPLWNRGLTTETFTIYDASVSSTMNAVTGQPNGISKLCLGCHDGSIALDAFGGAVGTVGREIDGAGYTTGTGNGMVGVDLSNDHPVSFAYDNTLFTADGGLFNPANSPANLTGTLEAELLFGTAGSATMECASCHDVHDPTNGFYLRMDNSSSELCLTCHVK